LTPALAQRLVGLAALTLLAGLISLAATHNGSRANGQRLPAPGGDWNRALAASEPLHAKARQTVCGHTLTAKTLGVAHPVLPCNVKLYLVFGGKQVLTEVVDRGPYVPGREFVLTHALAVALGLHGTQPIKWRYATTTQ